MTARMDSQHRMANIQTGHPNMTDDSDELPPLRGWAAGRSKRQYVRGGAHGHPGSRQPGCPECLAYYRKWKIAHRSRGLR